VRGELLKIFPFSPFPFILRVNKMRRIGGNEGAIFPSFPFPPLHLISPTREMDTH